MSSTTQRTGPADRSEPTAVRRSAAHRLAALTDREREVAIAVGSGASNPEVAASLFMSEATVKAHVSRLFAKLDAANGGRSRSSCTTPAKPRPKLRDLGRL